MSLTKEMLREFLHAVDKDFPVPLSDKQDLDEFSQKLINMATLCTAQENGRILALVAGYTENLVNNTAYVSIAAALPEARRKGYTSCLMREFIQISAAKGVDAVHLYAVPTNRSAMRMYEKLGFTQWHIPDEPRPMDAHLIYYIHNEV